LHLGNHLAHIAVVVLLLLLVLNGCPLKVEAHLKLGCRIIDASVALGIPLPR
jgi:hypothetical protein